MPEENNKQETKNSKSSMVILIIVVLVIVGIVGYAVYQKTGNKETQTTLLSTTELTTESTTQDITESTTQTTTEQTTKQRESDDEMMNLLAGSNWKNNFSDYMILNDGTIELSESSAPQDIDRMFFSIYARDDGQYDFEVTYNDKTTEVYIMATDFSYDGDWLYSRYNDYGEPALPSYMTLQGDGKLAGKWIFTDYYG